MKCTSVMVILNYNDMRVTEKLARKIKDYEYPDRIVVVDNASTDGSYEHLKGAFSKTEVDVIQAPVNGGYASGNNFGIRYAIQHYSPEYIFVANPDIDVSEDTLKKMIEVMQRHTEYGVAAPIVNQGYNAWNLPGFIGMIESLFLVWFNLDKKRIKSRLIALSDEVTDAGVVEGSFFLIRRSDYESIDGLDERTFLYAEEIILARRLRDKGKKVGVLPGLRYDHLHSQSIKKEYNASKRRAFPNFYQSFRIYNKYYLKTNILQDGLFFLCYGLAYFERFIYDIVMRFSGEKQNAKTKAE